MSRAYISCLPQAKSPIPLVVQNRVFASVHRSNPDGTARPHARLKRPRAEASFGATVWWFIKEIVEAAFIINFRLSPESAYDRHTPETARALAREGYCPACAYSLAGLEAESDGCVVCPVCGCAMIVGGGGVGAERREFRP